MSVISPADLLKLRNDHPHMGKFYLSILKPTVVYCGTVAGTPARGARAITVADVSGNISNCVAGNTILVGTACGDYSISRRRYRSRASNVITLDENSVVWAAGQYITVLDDHEIFPIYPFITDADPYTFYKDYDIAYTNQNTNIAPVAIAGPPKVGFLSSGSLTFSLDGSDSYAMAVGATISSYLWECAGGAIADSADPTTTITFTTAGQYWLKLTVTDSLGTSQSTYRRIYVHERTGANAPYTNFQVTGNPTGSYDSGGWDMQIRLFTDADVDDIPDGTQVVLWYESYYNGTEHYIGDNGNIKLAGYIVSENISNLHSSGYVDFSVATVNKLLDNCTMFSISLEEATSADTWYRFAYESLTVARAIHHLWKWHSTLLDACDVFLPVENTNKLIACDDMDAGTLWNITSWAYENGIFARGCCDRTGRVHFERDILLKTDAEQNATTEVMEILPIDITGEVLIQYLRNSDFLYSSVTASGTYVNGSDSTPYLSKAPGASPENRGQDTYNVERLCLASQTELNFITGRLYAQLNREIQDLRLTFAGNYPIDIAPQEWHKITISPDVRGITLIDLQIICRSVTDVINTQAGECHPESCIFEVRFTSVDGITETYPENPESPNSPNPPYTIPPYSTTPYTIPPSSNTFGVSLNIGTGSAVVSTGVWGYAEVPFDCVLEEVTLVADAAGSIVIDIWKSSYADYPPTDADSITASAPPTLSATDKSKDITLLGWTKICYKGDILYFNVDSAATVKLVALCLKGRGLK